ncbi:hypothetical protein JTE90_013468, partial [Oedothorax gibbosus]
MDHNTDFDFEEKINFAISISMNFLTGVSQKMTKKAAHSSAKYHKLTRTDDGFVDLQYQKQKPKIPWGGILLAVFLFIAGGLLIAFASLLFTGHINGQ